MSFRLEARAPRITEETDRRLLSELSLGSSCLPKFLVPKGLAFIPLLFCGTTLLFGSFYSVQLNLIPLAKQALAPV